MSNSSITRFPAVRNVLRILFILLFVALAYLAVKLYNILSPFTFSDEFHSSTIGTSQDLYDIGVACIDDGLDLDLFTINHSNRQLVLLSSEGREFEDQLVEIGLSQSRDFPGVEGGPNLPNFDKPGLYIFWDRGSLVIRSTEDFRCSGKIRLPRQLEIKSSGLVEVEKLAGNDVNFNFKSTGEVRLLSWEYYFLPIFELSDDLSLNSVYIGPGAISPAYHHFELPEQDRHGMAWADFDGNGIRDVFIARGGDQGMLADTHPDAKDEIFTYSEGKYREISEDLGFNKLGMPARSLQWVDVNSDQNLDLYIVNGRSIPPNEDAPNQLFLQDNTGHFTESGSDYSLDLPGIGISHWLDLDLDNDLDLIWCDSTSIKVFWNRSGSFELAFLAKLDRIPQQVSSADFNGDGYLDTFIASSSGNHLILNTGGSIRLVEPSEYSLPSKSVSANWVDYDNDGIIDLHVFPQGIYRQDAGGVFEETKILAMRINRKVHCSWFDADNDGDRDLVVAIEDPLPEAVNRIRERFFGRPKVFRPTNWKVFLVRNDYSGSNNWLQIILNGKGRNRPAIGARVEIETANGHYTNFVGHAEGSLRSQGHYRLYFGLGNIDSILSAKVIWPNGDVQSFEIESLDSLAIVDQN